MPPGVSPFCSFRSAICSDAWRVARILQRAKTRRIASKAIGPAPSLTEVFRGPSLAGGAGVPVRFHSLIRLGFPSIVIDLITVHTAPGLGWCGPVVQWCVYVSAGIARF
jgi:hypothetical protein